MHLREWFLTGIFICILAACGSAGGDGQAGGDEASDADSPAIIATSPAADAADALPVLQITATFSAPMDASTITTATFSVAGSDGTPVPGEVIYDEAAQQATFTPAAGLTPGATYTATVAAGATDLEGNGLAGDVAWNFTMTGFYFAVLSDTHVRIPGFPDDETYDNQGNLDRLSASIDTINANYAGAAFVAVTGDLVGSLFSSDPADYGTGQENPAETFASMMDGLTMDVHVALGNHDYGMSYDPAMAEMTTAGSDGEVAAMEAIWKKVLGIDPYSSVVVQGMRFIFLNSCRGAERPTVCPYSSVEAMCTGSFDAAQLSWLEGELANPEPAILFLHHPLFSGSASPLSWAPLGAPYLVATDDGIYDLLAASAGKILGIFVGHGHYETEDTIGGTILEVETGATGDHFGDAHSITLVGDDPVTHAIGFVRHP